MNIDIASKLIPKILTMLAQLCATGVIFALYRKYLHQPVLEYLDARALKMATDLSDAALLKEESITLKEEALLAQKEIMLRSKSLEEKMRLSAMNERQAIIDSAQDEIIAQRKSNQAILEQERETLLRNQNKEILDMALIVNQKILQDYDFDHDNAVAEIEKVMAKHHD